MITVENLGIRAGSFSLKDISFKVDTGQYACLMGKTGSGKTTLLEAICGLKSVTAGRIIIDGIDVTQMKPSMRGIGFVPQDGALFTTMSVHDHLAFALVIRKMKKSVIDTIVKELASLLKITHLLYRKPTALSGGERQRVAMGRALSFKPKILCMDEPLNALDDETREEMMVLLKNVQVETGVTVLHITHNFFQASRLADTTLFLRKGRLLEIDVTKVVQQRSGMQIDDFIAEQWDIDS